MEPSAPHYATFWQRKLAYAIDLLIVAGLCVPVMDLVYTPAPAAASTTQGIDIQQLQSAGVITPESAALVNLLSSPVMQLPSLEEMLVGFGVFIALSAIYNIVFVASRMRATPGKYVLGLRVLTCAGQKLGFVRSLMRHLASGISMGVLSGLGYITMGFNTQKAALHDLMCGTRVVHWRN